ncbi:PHD-finger domain-containing protein 1 [Elsinoe fawcettii]|nr:PHD-finger domain-containing protein 1 [Elsinoe fawcettii]
MTEALSLATPTAANLQPPVSVPTFEHFHHVPAPIALVSEETADDDDGEIACICAYTGDDGATVQCDKCLRWQHISCYYPPPKEVPGDDQKHYCTECHPQDDLDARKATERQRRAYEQRNGLNGTKRPAAKAPKKKTKDSPSLTAQVNGWSDRHNHIHNHDRKSASPRDQPPPAKKPKTSHRSSNSVSQPGRKRAGTVNAFSARSPSKSPELNTTTFIPLYSDEFLNTFRPQSPQLEMQTNLMNNITVTAHLSDWLTDPEAVSKATGGLTQAEIFKRWDGRIEDIPGRPPVDVEWMEDQRFANETATPRWPRLVVKDQVAAGTFIGELRGRISLQDEYIQEAENRWALLHHPEPLVFFHPQLPICIDARQEGSSFRFVRRSCQPNAELQTIITDGTSYHFCFMAKTEIMPEDEITVAWQVPQTIRERINSSLATSNNFEPKTREYISTWVSNVLANCGPCACDGQNRQNGQNNCLMAHYDRRGVSPPLPAQKPVKRRKKLPTLDTGSVNRSRSASEVRKTDHDDEGTESRSASGSQASASRDITPNTHYSGNASTMNGIPELSEREKKKLMREEEMFRRQEVESGRQHKKKRHSGGSALTPQGAIPSVRSDFTSTPHGTTNVRMQKPNGTGSRYADAGTSSRPQLTSRSSSSKRKAGSTKTPRKESAIPPRSISSTYVDASVQCDIEPAESAQSTPARPRKRYVSVSQRLLKRCFSNNFRKNNSTQQPSPPAEPSTDAMDIDRKDPDPVPIAPTAEEVIDKAPGEVEISHSPPQVVPLQSADNDTIMSDAEFVAAVKTESPINKQATPISPPDSSPSVTEHSVQVTSNPISGIRAPSVAAEQLPQEVEEAPVQQPLEESTEHAMDEAVEEPAERSSPAPSVPTDTAPRIPPMHLEMPPPLATFAAMQPSSAATGTPSLTLTNSPTAVTPGPASASLTAPLFSPNVNAAVSPSPVRKKMSLSDYTKRSKARESLGGETSNPSALAKEIKEEAIASPTSAAGDSVAEAKSETNAEEIKATEAVMTEEQPVQGQPDESVQKAPVADM